jgi:hypothetical protein
LVFIIVGVDMIVRPTEMTMIPDSTGRWRSIRGPDEPVHVSETGSQVYGGLSILMGVGISSLALYRGRK